MLLGLATGIGLGLIPSWRVPRPRWWQLLVVAATTAVVVLAFVIPIAGTFTDAVMVGRMDDAAAIPVLMQRTSLMPTSDDHGRLRVQVADARDASVVVDVHFPAFLYTESEFAKGAPAIITVRRGDDDRTFYAEAISMHNPMVTLPYIIGLEERARIIFFHVPMSWIAFVAYVVSMIFGIRFLVRRDMSLDSYSASSAGVGTLFCILATVTGSVWAKFNWGSFWNWDPRETSIIVLLLIYAAYFVLRSSVSDPVTRGRLSAIYATIGSVTAAFLIFVLPRLMPGLHPGSADDVSVGPLLSPKSDEINGVKQVLFAFSLASFTALFFWLVNLRYRLLEFTRNSSASTPSS